MGHQYIQLQVRASLPVPNDRLDVYKGYQPGLICAAAALQSGSTLVSKGCMSLTSPI